VARAEGWGGEIFFPASGYDRYHDGVCEERLSSFLSAIFLRLESWVRRTGAQAGRSDCVCVPITWWFEAVECAIIILYAMFSGLDVDLSVGHVLLM
jgi:hypothetical protein